MYWYTCYVYRNHEQREFRVKCRNCLINRLRSEKKKLFIGQQRFFLCFHNPDEGLFHFYSLFCLTALWCYFWLNFIFPFDDEIVIFYDSKDWQKKALKERFSFLSERSHHDFHVCQWKFYQSMIFMTFSLWNSWPFCSVFVICLKSRLIDSILSIAWY